MRKQKIHCEYPMASASATVLWNAISTASGLQGWFADKVTIVHKLCTFQWGEEETRQATILYIQPGCCIRFRWKDEDEPGCFFEMKLTNDELTNDLVLGGKKLCGILSESAVESETGRVEEMVIGIGMNVNNTAFPPELEGQAGRRC